MADRKFHKATLFRNVLQLEFGLNGGHNLSVTIPIEDAGRLASEVINALQTAKRQGYQIPPLQVDRNGLVELAHRAAE
jgi:hypothetical protein